MLKKLKKLRSKMNSTIFLLSVLICVISGCMEARADTCRAAKRVYLLFGPTRAGKSTFINKLYGSDIVVVGNPNESQSTTTLCRDITVQRVDLLDDELVTFIDVQGIYDTRLEDDEHVVSNICDFLVDILISNGIFQLDGIIIFNSLRDNNHVGYLLTLLGKKFGSAISKSCLVLATKGDNMPENRRNLKLDTLDVFCRAHDIKWIPWNNYASRIDEKKKIQLVELDPVQMSENLERLNDALRGLQVYNLNGLQDVLDEIEARALELFQNQEWSTTVRQVEVENDVLVEYLENVERTRYVPRTGASLSETELIKRAEEIRATVGEVSRAELVTIKVPKEVVFYEIVDRMIPVSYKKSRGGLSGLFGGTKTCTIMVPTQVPVARTVMIDEETQFLKPIMKLLDLSECIGMARQETIYREETYQATEKKIRVDIELTKIDVTIDVPTLSLEACRRRSLEEKKAELRKEYSFHSIFNRK